MKKILIFVATICFQNNILKSQTQQLEKTFELVLHSNRDSFFVKEDGWEKPYKLPILRGDTIDLGTDGYEGAIMRIWTDKDTISIPYVNSPYRQWLFIKVVNKEDTTVYRMRFNEDNSIFTNEYVIKNKKTHSIEIPEIYELANIILYLSSCSDSTFNKPKDKYTDKIDEYFACLKKHHLIKILNQKCIENKWPVYYGFRENSIYYKIDGDDQVLFDTPYKYVFYDQTELKGGEFGNLLYLVQDFVKVSKFTDFFKSNRKYYYKLIKRQGELLPIHAMWTWLEKEFPYKFDHYKVIFSPLIQGSHSTQKFFKGSFVKPVYSECLMFVNAGKNMDEDLSKPEKYKEAAFSGIVFTEIDHNYVNPSTSQFFNEIKTLLSDKNKWASIESQKNYGSEYSIFNEYMTHSLFCLYITENYTSEIAEGVIVNRIKLMERRGYPKFKAFNTIILKEAKDRKKSIYELYPLFFG